MIDPGLTGKTVLVTGADQPRGIGFAIAGAFAAQGAQLLITAAPGSRELENAADELRASGTRVIAAAADLADPNVASVLFDTAERALGPVDILVNNAAWSVVDTMAPGAESRDWNQRAMSLATAETFDAHFAVNARAPMLLMREFARRHADRGATWGRVINISTDGAACFPGEISYGASKNALESLTRSAAAEFAHLGITVNIVAPGPIQTGWIEPGLEPTIVRETPLGRLGEPGDIADVVVFLASEQGRWITGQRLRVNGGHRIGD